MPNIAVFIEQRDGALKKVAWQMISEARRLADAAGGEVWGVFVGGDATAATAEAGKYGADKVFAAGGEDLAVYNSELYGTALASFCKAQNPDVLLVGATAMGKDLGPKVAAKLSCACISDAVGLKYEGGWEVRRPVFAGKCFTDVSPTTAMAVVGIRPNAFILAEKGGTATAESFDPGTSGVTPKAVVKSIEASARGKRDRRQFERSVRRDKMIEVVAAYRIRPRHVSKHCAQRDPVVGEIEKAGDDQNPVGKTLQSNARVMHDVKA